MNSKTKESMLERLKSNEFSSEMYVFSSFPFNILPYHAIVYILCFELLFEFSSSLFLFLCWNKHREKKIKRTINTRVSFSLSIFNASKLLPWSYNSIRKTKSLFKHRYRYNVNTCLLCRKSENHRKNSYLRNFLFLRFLSSYL